MSEMLTDLQEVRQQLALDGNMAAVMALTLAIDQYLGLPDWSIRATIRDLKQVYCHLPKPKHYQCEACVGGGVNPPQCPNLATHGRMCAEHYQE